MKKIARNLMHKNLSLLQKGQIIVQENGQEKVFGQPSALTAVLRINNPQIYRKLLKHGALGVAQAYIDGDWETNDLTILMRIMIQNQHAMAHLDHQYNKLSQLITNIIGKMKKNTLSQSSRNIQAHYDLGNDFFHTFLDETMMYSSALFDGSHHDLHMAQLHKINAICEYIKPLPEDKILEIGTGWGSLAIHLAQHYGCHVYTTTISKKQYLYVKERIKSLKLESKITLLDKDYRHLEGQYDKIVSIEMIEAVGHEYFDTFFQACNNLLKPNGLLMLQAIIINEQHYEQAKHHVDFIKKYIFPGGCLPSISRIAQSIAKCTQLQWLHLNDMGASYAQTLRIWNNRFTANLDQVRNLGFSDEFIRQWLYYFSYCEAGFDEKYISVVQLLWRKHYFI